MTEKLKDRFQLILNELERVLEQVRPNAVEELIQGILKADRVFVYGQGRTGHITRAFAVRLMHLGMNVHFVGDTVTPAISPGDLCLVNSGTGETRFVYHVAVEAKRVGAALATITAHPQARLGSMADIVVEIPAPTKGENVGQGRTVQPAGSLFEQAAFLLMDGIVLVLMERLCRTPRSLQQRHANIE